MSARISSRQNALVKRFRDVARGEDPDRMLLDGDHLLREAIGSGIRIEAAAFADRVDGIELMRGAERGGADVVRVSDQVLTAMSPVREPSGVVAVAVKPALSLDDVLAKSPALVVMLSDVQDPGNVGAIIRVAEAAGATGVVAAGASANPFGWKALRGSMGSGLRLPLASGPSPDAAVADAKRRGCRVIATAPREGTSLFDIDLSGPIAVLIGGEGPGLGSPLLDAADQRVTIPMQPPVESLNAAVTAALILYEARRQRSLTKHTKT